MSGDPTLTDAQAQRLEALRSRCLACYAEVEPASIGEDGQRRFTLRIWARASLVTLDQLAQRVAMLDGRSE